MCNRVHVHFLMHMYVRMYILCTHVFVVYTEYWVRCLYITYVFMCVCVFSGKHTHTLVHMCTSTHMYITNLYCFSATRSRVKTLILQLHTHTCITQMYIHTSTHVYIPNIYLFSAIRSKVKTCIMHMYTSHMYISNIHLFSGMRSKVKTLILGYFSLIFVVHSLP